MAVFPCGGLEKLWGPPDRYAVPSPSSFRISTTPTFFPPGKRVVNKSCRPVGTVAARPSAIRQPGVVVFQPGTKDFRRETGPVFDVPTPGEFQVECPTPSFPHNATGLRTAKLIKGSRLVGRDGRSTRAIRGPHAEEVSASIWDFFWRERPNNSREAGFCLGDLADKRTFSQGRFGPTWPTAFWA